MTFELGKINKMGGLLIFNFNSHDFCVDIRIVRDIKKCEGVRIAINGEDEAVVYRDDIEYKLISLYKLMNYPEINITDSCRLIFIEVFNNRICFYVERVSEILTTDSLFIDNSLEMNLYHDNKYLTAVLRYKGSEISFINLETISKDIKQLSNVNAMISSRGISKARKTTRAN
jgi:chemotaxis signal transduction protein